MSAEKPNEFDVRINDAEKQRLVTEALFGSERGGFQHELMKMKDPVKFKESINQLRATAVGLPCANAYEVVSVSWFNNEKGILTTDVNREIVSKEELMQIFMSPDWRASQKGAGYYAETALGQVLLGTGRTEVIRGEVGPGKWTEDELREELEPLIKSGKITSDKAEEMLVKSIGTLKKEAVYMADIIKAEAPKYRAELMVWGAFGNHQQTVGDEKEGSKLFVTPGHSAPQGPDWKEFFTDDGDKRNIALKQIYAAGLSYETLVKENKKDLLIEGIHYKVEKGKMVPINEKVYVKGWTTETFGVWVDAVLNKTNGDLLAAYDAWYTAIVTGLIAKVAKDGVKVGDPPIVSSLDAWLMHFTAKQLNEAGLNEKGERKYFQRYKGKTGPINGIGKYPDSWIGCYFDEAKVGENGKSVFDLWWNDGVKMSEIPWIKTDIQKEEEEVRLSSFDGWLYTKFQLFKLLEAIQGTPSLRDLSGYTYWEGMGRSLDKAFGVVYNVASKADPLWNSNCAKLGVKNLPRRTVKRDGVEFVQTTPDSMNPRYQLFKSILSRYEPYVPGITNGPKNANTDTSIVFSERFTTMSEAKITESMLGSNYKAISYGIPIETFIVAYHSGGMLTNSEIKDALYEMYDPILVRDIINNSPRVRSLLGEPNRI